MAFVEDVLKRTQKAKHFYDADTGKWKAEYSIADQHYHDGSAWQDIDENLADDGLDGFTHKCEKTRHIIRLGAASTRRWYPRRAHPTEYVEFGRLQGWTGTAWSNIDLGTPTRTGQKIAWSTTNFDLSLTNTWRKIKLEAILKTTTAKRRLRWAVTLNNLTWDNWQLHGLDDEVAGIIEKPVAWDANGSRKKPNLTLTYDYSGGYVEFGGDLSAAVLPITIDPTFTDGYGGDVNSAYDTYLDYTDPDTIKGALTYITSETDNARALLRFDLSSIAAESTCTTATLTLVDDDCEDATHYIYLLSVANRDWTEAGATWNHKIHTTDHWAGSVGCNEETTDYLATAIGSFSTLLANAVGTSYTCDLTNTTVEGLFGGNIDLLIKGSPSGNNWFFSSDRATTGYRPKLVVEYTTGGGITGATTWGHVTGVVETNVRTFAGHWTGTGVIENSGDGERVTLNAGEYMISEAVNMGAGSTIQILQNNYASGSTTTLEYRQGSTSAECGTAAFASYSGTFTCSGFVQIRVTSTL